jgi:hypothetical protein
MLAVASHHPLEMQRVRQKGVVSNFRSREVIPDFEISHVMRAGRRLSQRTLRRRSRRCLTGKQRQDHF